jgi:hypothetical protein
LKSITRISFVLLLAVIVLAALPWQTAKITETGFELSSTGFDGFPQVGLFLTLQLVTLFGSRYWGRRASAMAKILVALFSTFAILPLIGSALSGELRLLQKRIESATGISDWGSQLDVIDSLTSNMAAVWGIVLAMSLLVLANLSSLFISRSTQRKSAEEWLN